MRSGEAMVTDISPLGRGSMTGVISFPGSSFPASNGGVRDADMMWREKTGEKTGWLVKRDEERIMRIMGMRCLGCGYLEFYAEQ